MIVDAHGHARTLLSAAPSRTIGDAASVEELIRLLDEVSISRAVVFAPPWKGGVADPDYARSNLEISKMQERYPDRVLGAARVSPNFGDRAVDEVRRCFEVYGFRAVKLNPDWESFRMAGNRTVAEILDLALRMGNPVIVHRGDSPRSQPAAFLEVVRGFSPLPFVLAHIGHEFVDDAIWMAARFENVYVDTSEARVSAVARALRGAPLHKNLYGSDAPYHLPEVELEKIRLLPGISVSSLNAVLGENALRLFWSKDAQ